MNTPAESTIYAARFLCEKCHDHVPPDTVKTGSLPTDQPGLAEGQLESTSRLRNVAAESHQSECPGGGNIGLGDLVLLQLVINGEPQGLDVVNRAEEEYRRAVASWDTY